ncbi:DUF2335 domain-containing protein [Lacticaseibacillus hulanensis]|uniref:DUF2335 domain-containing protein n=1 Tax=Lacticaseibacillus hulanensis TaxID=2493111 RepID=UPI000FD94531|nr:DUF2335 domain-containing protein [Lacticaseibacillus hulanensis]
MTQDNHSPTPRQTRAALRRARLNQVVGAIGGGESARSRPSPGSDGARLENTGTHYRVIRVSAPGATEGEPVIVPPNTDAGLPRSNQQSFDPDLPPISQSHFAQQEHVAVNTSNGSVAMAARQSSVPLPDARELTAYNEAAPDAANRILQLAEQQAQHRQKLEKARLVAEIRDQYLGLVLGFAVCIAGICAGAYVAVAASPLAGSALSFGALASLVGTFVYGSRQ